MNLRPYQLDALQAIRKEWTTRKSTLLVLPTGTGKTIVFAALIDQLVRAQQARVLVLAHRGELLEQAADKIHRVTGLNCAIEKAEESAIGSWERITVGSVQTLMRESRLERHPKTYYTHIIVDEAHHALADSYQRILQYFSDAKVLGVTATPDRGDQQCLGTYFESLAFEYSMPEAIRDGYLSRISAQTIPLELDLTLVRQSAGDYNAGDLGHALEPYLDQIAKEIATVAADRKTVVFLPLIQTSQKMRDALLSCGISAGEVNGESPDRRDILTAFDRGDFQVLCNSMLLTEGWDCPSVDCIVCLRPTRIRSLYAQIIGRGTRIHPVKKNLLLLDFLWLTSRHDLVRPAHLVATSADVAQKMTRALETGGAADLQEIKDAAEKEILHEREAALIKQLEEQRRKKRRLVDPLQYAFSTMDQALIDYVPAFPWEKEPSSEKQREQIENAGVFAPSDMPAGQAAALLHSIEERRKQKLATPKQIRLLERMGFHEVGLWKFDSASKMIARISANGWRVPAGVQPAIYIPKKETQT